MSLGHHDEIEEMKPILERLRMGDHINDQELAKAIKFYDELEWKLRALGKEFELARRPVFQRLWEMREWQRNRKENRT